MCEPEIQPVNISQLEKRLGMHAPYLLLPLSVVVARYVDFSSLLIAFHFFSRSVLRQM